MNAGPTTTRPVIKLLAIIEADRVTGPAKNLISFSTKAIDHAFSDLPAIETSVATFRRGLAETENGFIAAARAAGIEAGYIDERFRFDTRVLRSLRELVNRRNPSIIQTHGVKAHFLMRLSGLWRSRPWVAFHHGYTATDLKMRAYNQLDRWSLRAAARVVTVSEEFAGELASRGVRPEKITVIQNAVDREKLSDPREQDVSELRKRLGLIGREMVVISAGRLSREKGHVDLVEAFSELRHTHPELNAKLVIAGEGPERNRIAKAVESLRLSDCIKLAGHVSDVGPLYAIADVFALPSHSEGSPNVLLEAMAAGLPIVAARVGGVPEIVTNEEDALLVEPRNKTKMAEALARILTDRELAARLASNARGRVRRAHSVESRVRSLVSLYSQLTPEIRLKERPVPPALETVLESSQLQTRRARAADGPPQRAL